jgi:hypothetical protein
MKLYPPWEKIDDKSDFFEKELRRELHASHKLYSVNARAIARCGGNDDVVFELEDCKIAVIHLTYSKEKSDKYPWFKIYESRKHWIKEQVVTEFYESIGISKNASDFTHILIDLMVGHIILKEFENWVYSACNLESEIGEQLYFKLISADFSLLTNIIDILNEWFINQSSSEDIDLRHLQ